MCQKRVLKQRFGVIESPGYPDPYPNDAKCDYQIEVPRGNKVNVTFSHFGVAGVGNCTTDYLAVSWRPLSFGCAFIRSMEEMCELFTELESRETDQVQVTILSFGY